MPIRIRIIVNLLKERDQLFGSLSNIKCTLDNLLRHEVLVEGLLLGPEDQDPALRLEMGSRAGQSGEAGRHGRVTRLLE